MITRDMLAGVSDPQALMDELSRRDFATFFMRAYPVIRGGDVVEHNWHIDAIAQALDDVRRGANRRLLVTIPPRHLKSLMISVAWVAWMLGRNPTLNFVCASYANELSAKHARDCRALMFSEFYRRIFPRTIIRKSRSAAHDFETTTSGGRLATSVGGTLTGRGGEYIIIDDPIKPDEALSEVVREAANEWFFSTLLSRLNNPTTGAIMVVMQRLHQYDLVGMLLEAQWPELCLPAIGQQDLRVRLTRGRTKLFKEGELLDPARWPLAVLERRRAEIGSLRYAAQYLQAPLPAKGNIIKAVWLKEYEDAAIASGGGQVIQSWDIAAKDGERNDYSVCITALVRGRTVYILDVWREKVEFTELWKKVPFLAQRYQANALLIEETSNGIALLNRLRNEPPAGVPSPIARRPKLDKVARLEAASTMIEPGDLLLPANAPWLATFKSELLGFPSTRHDDQVDALSQLMNWVDERRHWDVPETAGPEVFDLSVPSNRRKTSWDEFLDAWGS